MEEQTFPLRIGITAERTDESWDDTRATLTTKCPKCLKEWTREVFFSLIFNGMALENCPICCPGEEMEIILSERYT